MTEEGWRRGGTNNGGEARRVGQYWCEEVEKMTARGEASHRGARGAFYRLGNGVEGSGGG
jgi:hypothetical protein